MKNWKTTIAGIISSLVALLALVNWKTTLGGVLVLLGTTVQMSSK